MEDMSPNEEAAYFGAPALATPVRRLRYWLEHPRTRAVDPADVEAILRQLESQPKRPSVEESEELAVMLWRKFGAQLDMVEVDHWRPIVRALVLSLVPADEGTGG